MEVMGSGFYTTGATLRADAPSYITRRADDELLSGLRQGEFCYVLDTRQMGKSSLMVRTAARLREEGVLVAILDLQSSGQQVTIEQWYCGLLVRLGEQLGMEDELLEFWEQRKAVGPLQRWLEALERVVLQSTEAPIVLFIDEIDIVRSLPFSTDEFFAGIRECYVRRAQNPQMGRLTFCLLGVATPADLIQNVHITPFNIGWRIELNDFTIEEAAPLARGLGVKGRALLKRVLYWTGGHPYLTQRLCQVIAESPDITTPRAVDSVCESLFLSHKARETDYNLSFVRNRILMSEADIAGLLDLYRHVRAGGKVRDDEAIPLISILRLSGVVRVVNGFLRTRNRIYDRAFGKEWIRANMSDAEMRRQRAAYLRGIIRAAGLAAVVIIVVGGLAVYSRNLAIVAGHDRNRALKAERAAKLSLRGEYRARQEAQRRAASEKLARQAAQDSAKKERSARQDALRAARQARQWALYEHSLRYDVDINEAQRRCEADPPDINGALNLLNAYRPKPGDRVDLRGFEWGYLWRLCHSEPLTREFSNSDTLFSQDGMPVLMYNGSVKTGMVVVDVTTGREILALKPKEYVLPEAYSSSNGKRLATANGWTPSGKDYKATIWDSSSGRKLCALNGHTTNVALASFSPDGKRVVTIASPLGAGKCDARIWNATTGRELLKLHQTDALKYDYFDGASASFSPDGKRVFAISRSHGTMMLWDATSGRDLFARDAANRPRNVRSASFSPDGKRVMARAAGYGGTARIWDAASGREFRPWKPGLEVNMASFSPDGKRGVALSKEQTYGGPPSHMQIWGATSGLRVFSMEPGPTVRLMSFSCDSKRFITAQDSKITIWDAANGREIFALIGHGNVISASFSPDGKRVVTVDGAGSWLTIWNATNGRKLLTLKADGYYGSASFCQGGKQINITEMLPEVGVLKAMILNGAIDHEIGEHDQNIRGLRRPLSELGRKSERVMPTKNASGTGTAGGGSR